MSVPWPKETNLPTLPQDFAMSLLNKELALDKSPRMETLQEVINLYSSAIEYYEHCNDPKTTLLQERMHNLLLKPHIMRIMQGEKTPPPAPRRQQFESSKQHYTRGFMSRVSQKKDVLNSKLKRMVERHRSNNKRTVNKAINDLQSQESNMKKRLGMRKSASANNSFNMSSDSIESRNLSCDDFSFFDDPNTSFLHGVPKDLRKEIEKTLERTYSDQSTEVIKIMTKFKVQIETVDNSEAGDARKRELEQAMQAEIDQVKEVYEERRQTLINNIKSQYN